MVNNFIGVEISYEFGVIVVGAVNDALQMHEFLAAD